MGTEFYAVCDLCGVRAQVARRSAGKVYIDQQADGPAVKARLAAFLNHHVFEFHPVRVVPSESSDARVPDAPEMEPEAPPPGG